MNMNASTASKKKKPMMPRGFMCHSQASTAVCVSSADAALSAIVPASRTTRMMINNNYNNARYSRLVESRRLFDPVDHGNKPIVSLYSMIKKEPALSHRHHRHHQAKAKMSLKNTPSVTLSADNNVYQEVVMRVALHCQGCAAKVKKHISKMEGVTSFSIDLETKLVTVRGHVSPVGVTESISKVKKAELLLCS